MKQTAMQILIDDLKQECKAYYENNEIYLKSCIEAEKQQIIDAFTKHRNSKFKNSEKIDWEKSAEQYYNSTYLCK